jgi:cell shape-determining protein MreC
MTYLRRSNLQAKKHRTTTISIVLALAIVFSVQIFFPAFYPSILMPIASVAWKAESSVSGSIAGVISFFRSKNSLVSENERLQGEILSRDAGALLLDGLKRENDELKALLGRSAGGKDVVALVLSRPPLSFYDTLIVDVGADDGIVIGDKVYANGAVLVGDVSEVFGSTARISLFSTPGRAVSVLFGSSTVQAQAVGKGGGNFEARLPVGIDVAEGDTIVFPHLRSHVFGVIERIVADSTDSLQTIMFKAPVNIHQLRFVEVETSSRAR